MCSLLGVSFEEFVDNDIENGLISSYERENIVTKMYETYYRICDDIEANYTCKISTSIL